MNTSNIVNTLEILFTYFVLFFANEVTYYINSIKYDWIVHRCNPVVMIFAEMFGYDSKKNFTQCVQSIQTENMKYLLQPVNYNISAIGNNAKEMGNSFNSVRHMFSHIRSYLSNIVSSIMMIFIGIFLYLVNIIINIKEFFNKLIAVFNTLNYIGEASTNAAVATFDDDGAVGGQLRNIEDKSFV